MRGVFDVGPNKAETLSLNVPHAIKETGEVSLALAVMEAGRLLYLSAGRQLPRETVPLLHNGGANAVLENALVRYEFDAVSGALLSILHKATNTELRPRKVAAPVFALDAVSFKSNPVFFREDDVQILTPDASTCRECGVEGTTLRQRHVFPMGVEVNFTVELPAVLTLPALSRAWYW